MNPELPCRTIAVEALVREVSKFRKEGYRLAQISATRLPDQVELTYSFDKELRLEHLRVQLPAATALVPSITSVFWCAFLYENELHDLFNVQVDGLAVDFHGSFYKTALKFPFASTKIPANPAAKPTAGPAVQSSGNGAPALTGTASSSPLPAPQPAVAPASTQTATRNSQ